MDWQSILLTAVSIVLTAVVSWLTQRLITWINSKMSNSKNAKYLTDAVEIVARAVKVTYQTYVQALKDKNMFDKAAQLQALTQARNMVLSQLSRDTKNYIASNFGDIESWISNMIESTIYDLKNKFTKGEILLEGNTEVEVDEEN